MGETNGFTKDEAREFHKTHTPVTTVLWTHPDLKRIIRLRLVSDRGFPWWDVSYCYGEMKDGTTVRVSLPFDQLPKNKPVNASILEHAKRDKVYAKGLGIFDVVSTLL